MPEPTHDSQRPVACFFDAERMQAFARDLDNLLEAVRGYSQLMFQQMAPTDSLRRCPEVLLAVADDGNELTRRLRSMAEIALSPRCRLGGAIECAETRGAGGGEVEGSLHRAGVPSRAMRAINAIIDALAWCAGLVMSTYLSFKGIEPLDIIKRWKR
jgi:hypothetical protein